MPTLWSQTLIPTARQVPAEAEVPSHQLMLRAGLIRKLGAGMYTYMPLGLRSLHKAMQIVREEMANANAYEVLMPAMVPIEFYKKTGRDEAYGDNLFRLQDRHGRQQALGPTHEEIITELIGAYVESYKQLPLTLYQIQTKFRDEFRPRFGVLRSREFQMKDAYSFHTHIEGPGGLDETYQNQFDAYCRIFSRCGLPYLTVEAESGPIGGSASHEFMVPSPTGEDTILESDKNNYAANVEKCEIGPRTHDLSTDPVGELAQVHTPDCAAIEDVAKFLKTKPKNMLKSMVFQSTIEEAELTGDERHPTFRLTLAIVRGDHDVNEGKIKAAILGLHPKDTDVQIADEALARTAGFAIGYVGPHAAITMPDEHIAVFVDHDAAQGGFWVAGANKPDHHVKYFNWKRDVVEPLAAAGQSNRMTVTDIRNAEDGDASPKNDGGVLHTRKGIEIGHVFKLGDKYTRAMDVATLGPDNQRLHPIMGCYGIGVNRILAAAIEREGGHDENGIIWPAAIAPYHVIITPVKYDGQAKDIAHDLAAKLEARGHDVIIDNRDERPGVKFKDADLIGIPVRIVLGDKGLAAGQIELKRRTSPKAEMVELDKAVDAICEALKTM